MKPNDDIFDNIRHFAIRAAREALEQIPLVNLVLPQHLANSDCVHLEAAIKWLLRTVEVNGCAGSAHSYIIGKGWRPPYPETTGYVLKTFLRLADAKGNRKYEQIARDLADWLVSVQLDNGGIAGLDIGSAKEPIVFNTGMVLLGWNAIFERTAEEKHLNAAVRAGNFLLTCIADNGCFTRHAGHGIVHTYDARAAWALLQLGLIVGNKEYISAASANLNWTLLQQTENGFFLNNIFEPNTNALTHSIGYVLSALIEAFHITANTAYVEAVTRTCEVLIRLYGIRGRIVSELSANWSELSNHICLTGYCQIAIVLLQCWKLNRDVRYLNLALQLIDDVKRTQWLSERGDYSGGIPGSYPIYGRYARLQYPNWATKFFIDALLLRIRSLKSYENSFPHELSDGGQQKMEAAAD